MTSTPDTLKPTSYTFRFWNTGPVTWTGSHASGGVTDDELSPLDRADAEAIIAALREQFPEPTCEPAEGGQRESDDPNLDCAEHGFVYTIGSAGCQVCLERRAADDPWGPVGASYPQDELIDAGRRALGWPEQEDLTAGTTAVRLHLLSCGHVTWIAYEFPDPKTVNYCLACPAEVTVLHYIDQQAIDA